MTKSAAQDPQVKPSETTLCSDSQEEKKGKDTAKKEKKDVNQRSLTNFFRKKPAENVEFKEDIKPEQPTQNSRFKCLGAIENRPVWDDNRLEAFEKVIAKECAKPEVSDLLELAKNQQQPTRASKSSRKIFINIHDSSKRIKGKFDSYSSKIGGKTPLVKDETQLDYDIDSEEEIQEQVDL